MKLILTDNQEYIISSSAGTRFVISLESQSDFVTMVANVTSSVCKTLILQDDDGNEQGKYENMTMQSLTLEVGTDEDSGNSTYSAILTCRAENKIEARVTAVEVSATSLAENQDLLFTTMADFLYGEGDE